MYFKIQSYDLELIAIFLDNQLVRAAKDTDQAFHFIMNLVSSQVSRTETSRTPRQVQPHRQVSTIECYQRIG
jgi:hypothetical protein